MIASFEAKSVRIQTARSFRRRSNQIPLHEALEGSLGLSGLLELNLLARTAKNETFKQGLGLRV